MDNLDFTFLPKSDDLGASELSAHSGESSGGEGADVDQRRVATDAGLVPSRRTEGAADAGQQARPRSNGAAAKSGPQSRLPSRTRTNSLPGDVLGIPHVAVDPRSSRPQSPALAAAVAGQGPRVAQRPAAPQPTATARRAPGAKRQTVRSREPARAGSMTVSTPRSPATSAMTSKPHSPSASSKPESPASTLTVTTVSVPPSPATSYAPPPRSARSAPAARRVQGRSTPRGQPPSGSACGRFPAFRHGDADAYEMSVGSRCSSVSSQATSASYVSRLSLMASPASPQVLRLELAAARSKSAIGGARSCKQPDAPSYGQGL